MNRHKNRFLNFIKSLTKTKKKGDEKKSIVQNSNLKVQENGGCNFYLNTSLTSNEHIVILFRKSENFRK